MELKLEKTEIEQILLVHVNQILPEAGINRIEWDCSRRSIISATFDHTDLPPETGDE